MSNTLKLIRLTGFLLLAILISSCASTTTIGVVPRSLDAKVYADGRYIGQAPAVLRDSKITGASTMIRIEVEGYEDYVTYIEKSSHLNMGALVGGIFFVVPYAWILGYEPYYEFFFEDDMKITEKKEK
jgi:hypothetical protein